ncbi:hypothetical protein B0H16DRAFT_1733919 [Mycena metata]|uniref:Uncharacterized protein n=1 Tax=Mycena metata TaxID=1033252 RepID=A0AAD7HWY3_9AGAR|nr:hypothetical protein B0H16DRAFT_1739776 [Mycena metata]KAJ7730177.1 hypothetical protein B0H16DRAFT_1733919 [Mycena metata]
MFTSAVLGLCDFDASHFKSTAEKLAQFHQALHRFVFTASALNTDISGCRTTPLHHPTSFFPSSTSPASRPSYPLSPAIGSAQKTRSTPLSRALTLGARPDRVAAGEPGAFSSWDSGRPLRPQASPTPTPALVETSTAHIPQAPHLPQRLRAFNTHISADQFPPTILGPSIPSVPALRVASLISAVPSDYLDAKGARRRASYRRK